MYCERRDNHSELRRSVVPSLTLAAALLLMVLTTTAAPASQQPDFAAMDAFVESQMQAHRIPGLALAITRGDEVVHTRGFGTAGDGRDMTPQTPLYIGSVSKSFTALAVMQLVEQGKIDLAGRRYRGGDRRLTRVH